MLTAATLILGGLSSSASEHKTSFNDNWKFSLQDNPESQKPDFNDNGWRALTLPHDWSIEHSFDKNARSGNDGGYLPTGTGWYRKTFKVSPGNTGKKTRLYFEGAYMNSDIYVNGQHAGGHPYGYTSFFVDITPFLMPGENVVAVRVDNSGQKNSRWYSGSGIFRNVWLIETDKMHVANHGVRITTPSLSTADIAVTVSNESDIKRDADVCVMIDGYKSSRSISLNPGESNAVELSMEIPGAKPWSPDSPALYTACISISENGKIIDRVEEQFGFRTIEWSAIDGFKLNGKPILINGCCVHHDNGILGAAAYDRAEYKRVELLKDAGFNAVRTSHNIPSESFLNACDKIGLLVIDEAFDGWRVAKNDRDYHELFDRYWQEDLDAMVMRDRNHPSVICWSIGNEVIERDNIEVVTTARKLAERCRTLDPGRPVTSALANWGKVWETYDPLAEQHDIVGYNYTIHESENDHRRVPDRVMWQTESFPNDAWKNFRKVKDYPYIIGDFVWTGMDYIGESGIGRWYYEGDVKGEHFERPLYPWHASYCGDIDLTGLRKPISHYRSMLWNDNGEHLYIAVKEPDNYKGLIKTTMWGTWPTSESWNWPGHEGKPIDVEVYSHYPAVRLYLNGNLVGEKNVEEMKAVFSLPYQAGTLTAEGIRDGKVEQTVTIKTAGEVSAIRLTPDRQTITAGNGDLSYIIIEAVDKDGNVVPVADNALEVSVAGNASLLALGNADIKDEDSYSDNTHKIWRGRALAVVRGNGKKGKAKVKVASPGLKTQSVVINIR